MKKITSIAVIFLTALGIVSCGTHTIQTTEELAAPIKTTEELAAQTMMLTDKLIKGSPWVFTTQYEETEYKFRYGEDGSLERESRGNWIKVRIEDGEFKRETINGHTITIKLNNEGTPNAVHSKHSSSFKSKKAH